MIRSAIFIVAILAATAAHSAPLATEGFVTNKIAAAISQIPPPDFSTGNTQLVATIEATAPIPTWDTLSGKPTFAPVATSGAYSDLSGKPTIPTTAADIGALPIDGGTMTGNLVMGYNSLFQINGGGNAKFQFSWGSALDNLIISAYRETIGSYSIRFPTREGLLALTSDIPDVPAWALAAQKPTYTAGEVGATSPTDVSNIVSTAYVREKLGVYLYVGEDGGIYVHTNED